MRWFATALFGGLILGAIFGAGIALGQSELDRCVRTRTSTDALVGAPCTDFERRLQELGRGQYELLGRVSTELDVCRAERDGQLKKGLAPVQFTMSAPAEQKSHTLGIVVGTVIAVGGFVVAIVGAGRAEPIPATLGTIAFASGGTAAYLAGGL